MVAPKCSKCTSKSTRWRDCLRNYRYGLLGNMWCSRYRSFQCFQNSSFNIHTMDWDDELLEMLSVPRKCFRVDNSGSVGLTKDVGFYLMVYPLLVWLEINNQLYLDRLAFKQDLPNVPMELVFVLMNTGNNPIPSNNALLTTVGWRLMVLQHMPLKVVLSLQEQPFNG